VVAQGPAARLAGDGSGPRVSVVMPVYNGMPYLPLTLDSILRQTFRDFEFIVINDGSTDATAENLAACAARDRRLRVLTLPGNRGIVAALNSGLDAARGEFIARMDADDIALPERLERQVGFLDAHPDHVLVGSSCSFVDSAGKVTFRDTYWREVAHWELNWIAHFFTAMLHPTAMFRGAPVRDNGLRYEERCRHAEDMDFFARLLMQGKGALLREPLLQCRRVGSGLTASSFSEQKRTARDIAVHYLTLRYPDLAARTDAIPIIAGMLQRQGLPADWSLTEVFKAIARIESLFLRGLDLNRRQRRRIHCLTAFWLLWGIFQAGRMRPSREMLAMLWRGRRYWRMFGVEAAALGLRHAEFAFRRARQPCPGPSGGLSCASG
jgi:glycosyltransferase involved in cell wall biosynthesis